MFTREHGGGAPGFLKSVAGGVDVAVDTLGENAGHGAKAAALEATAPWAIVLGSTRAIATSLTFCWTLLGAPS